MEYISDIVEYIFYKYIIYMCFYYFSCGELFDFLKINRLIKDWTLSWVQCELKSPIYSGMFANKTLNKKIYWCSMCLVLSRCEKHMFFKSYLCFFSINNSYAISEQKNCWRSSTCRHLTVFITTASSMNVV